MHFKLTQNTSVTMYPIRWAYHPDLDNYSLVRWDIDESISTNKEGFQIIQLLSQGKKVGDICSNLTCDKYEVYSLIRLLIDVGFINRIDHQFIPQSHQKIQPQFFHVPRKLFSFVLLKPVILTSFLFIVLGTLMIFLKPHLIPTYKNYFWSSNLFLVYVVNFIIGYGVVFIHELAHFITSKAVGAESRTRFSTRFIFLTVETEHYHLALIPRRLRYVVYLSGVYCDLLIICLSFYILAIVDRFSLQFGFGINLLQVAMLSSLGGIIGNLWVFMETDFYNLISDYFDYQNLYNDFRKYIFLKAKRWKSYLLYPFKYILTKIFYTPQVLSEADLLSQLTKKEKRTLRFYALFVLCGLFAITFMTFFFTLPRDVIFLGGSLHSMYEAYVTNNFTLFIQSIIIFLLVSSEYVILFYLLTRKILFRKSLV